MLHHNGNQLEQKRIFSNISGHLHQSLAELAQELKNIPVSWAVGLHSNMLYFAATSRHSSVRTSGNRQDPDCKGRGQRDRSVLLSHQWTGDHEQTGWRVGEQPAQGIRGSREECASNHLHWWAGCYCAQERKGIRIAFAVVFGITTIITGFSLHRPDWRVTAFNFVKLNIFLRLVCCVFRFLCVCSILQKWNWVLCELKLVSSFCFKTFSYVASFTRGLYAFVAISCCNK